MMMMMMMMMMTMTITMRIFNSDSSHLPEIAPLAPRAGCAELLQEYSKQEDKHHYKQARLAQQSGKVLTDGWKGWHRDIVALQPPRKRYVGTVQYGTTVIL